MGRIFISYRRGETGIWVGRLADELRRHFPPEQIFQDVASIDPGAPFKEVLNRALESAAAMLVVIGPQWLAATDRQGRKRLEQPGDWVRQEVAESLRRPGVRVFPLLVDGAEMPVEEDLPEPLKPLAERHAIDLTVHHWTHDVAQLIQTLKRVSDEGVVREEEKKRRETEQRAAKEEANRRAEAERATQAAEEAQRRKAEAEARRRRKAESPYKAVEEKGRTGLLTAQAPSQPGAASWKKPATAIGAILFIGLLVFFVLRPEPRPVRPVVATPAKEPTVRLPVRESRPDPTPSVAAPSATAAAPPQRKSDAAVPDALPKAVATFKPGESFRDCTRCPEMVGIPAGTYRIASPHQVTFALPFAVGKYEVTFEQWDACVAADGCTHRPDDHSWGRGRRPVINVSWQDAQSYVSWLSRETGKPYRLLSESEWDYAARAGTTMRYSWGDEAKSKRADFWEWVQDCYRVNYGGVPRNGQAWERADCGLRVIRDASRSNATEDNRSGGAPTDRLVNRGFRVARTR